MRPISLPQVLPSEPEPLPELPESLPPEEEHPEPPQRSSQLSIVPSEQQSP